MAADSKPARKRAPRKPKAPKDYLGSCDNHPLVPAVISTTRGGKISTQRFCTKCLLRLPPGYVDG